MILIASSGDSAPTSQPASLSPIRATANVSVMSHDLEQATRHCEHHDAEEPHHLFHDAELSGEAGDLLRMVSDPVLPGE